jgi:predicted RND superfamily exporter protein
LDIKKSIENGSESLARKIYRHPVITFMIMLLISVTIASQLPKLKQDNSNDVYFHKNDPDKIIYDSFREQFGSDEVTLIIVTPKNVFDSVFLNKLKEFHQTLENDVPYIKDIVSLINVRNIRGERDELVVEDLVESIPDTPGNMERLKERVMKSEFYRNYVISEDGQATLVMIEPDAFSSLDDTENMEMYLETEEDTVDTNTIKKTAALTDQERSEMVRSIEQIVEKFNSSEFPIHYSGQMIMDDYINAAVAKDVAKYLSLAILTSIIFMVVLFRRFSGAFISIIIVILSMVCTISLMAIFSTPFTLITSILPSLIIAIGIGSSIHILAVFYRRVTKYGEEKETAIVSAFGHSGLPLLMTGVTTAVGLLSFCTSKIANVVDLGLYGAVGILFILIYTFILIPALIAIIPIPVKSISGKTKAREKADKLLSRIALFSTEKAWLIMTVSLMFFAISSSGLIWQGFGHDYFEYFPDDSEVNQGNNLLDSKMKGIMYVEIIIDLGVEDALYEPDTMKKIEALSNYIEKYRNEEGIQVVGKTYSIVDVLKETHMALNDNNPDFYAIPDNRNSIAQELLLFENSGSDDLEKLVDSRFSLARLSVKVRRDDAAAYLDFLNIIQQEAFRLFDDSSKVKVTGLLSLFAKTIDMMMVSMARSYIMAGVMITILMILMLGDIRLGLISMIPNLSPIIITLGVMGWLGIKLDMANILIGTVALGLAVDDTIHFFHVFRKYYKESQNVLKAATDTMLTTGRAMVFTTLVLVSGFWLFMLSSFQNLIHFGLLTGISLIVALLADILFVPAMMEMIVRYSFRKLGPNHEL